MRVAASTSEAGRGMLPMGSVGIFMSRIGPLFFDDVYLERAKRVPVASAVALDGE